MKVRIGVSLGVDGQTDPGALGDAVAAIEHLGFDSLWLAERITTATPTRRRWPTRWRPWRSSGSIPSGWRSG